MKVTATFLSTVDFCASGKCPHALDSIGRGGAIRTPDPLRPRHWNAQKYLPLNHLFTIIYRKQSTAEFSRCSQFRSCRIPQAATISWTPSFVIALHLRFAACKRKPLGPDRIICGAQPVPPQNLASQCVELELRSLLLLLARLSVRVRGAEEPCLPIRERDIPAICPISPILGLIPLDQDLCPGRYGSL